jgi:hypothetical protein
MVNKDARTSKFVLEPMPWKSKKLPKTPPEPLPAVGGICWTFVARRSSGKTLLACNIVRAYSRSVSAVIVLSPTIHLDQKWKAVLGYKNVLCGDKISNEILMEIMERQKADYDPGRPQDCQTLLVIDDFGNLFRRKEVRQAMNILYTSCRHYGLNLITCVQSIQHLESIQMSNSTQFCFWNCNNRSLKKICNDLSTATMDEKQMEKFISENTVEPYSFVFIDYLKPVKEMFWIRFDRPYQV